MEETTYKNITEERNGILYYTGRILPTSAITAAGKMTAAMLDLSATTFFVPVTIHHSPIAYSIINEVHCHEEVKHSGIEITLRYVLKKTYIIHGRELVKKIKKNCQRCSYLLKKALDVTMGLTLNFNLMITPAFYVSQVDICGPFKQHSNHHRRTTIKIWFTVFYCCTTSATKIKLIVEYSSTSFLLTFSRFSCETGYPKVILVNGGCQLLKACENMSLDLYDTKYKLNENLKVDFEVCPVGAHNMHGRVERKILEIKKSMEKSYSNERLSMMLWEAAVAEIGNAINNSPIALGNRSCDFEAMDLITPTRLLMGGNNERSPEGSLEDSNDYERILKQNNKIYQFWFKNWLISPKMYQN